jgi:aminoglycoside 6'-N-acetyltransferase
MLTRWLAEPHVQRFYQKTPVTLDDVIAEYGAAIRGKEPSLVHLAFLDGAPFAYLQCYRNTDYPLWAALIGANDGISVDLFIGDPAFLHRGLGRAALTRYLDEVAFPAYPGERRAYIGHDTTNTAALSCSEAVGFRPARRFFEDGTEMQLLMLERTEP